MSATKGFTFLFKFVAVYERDMGLVFCLCGLMAFNFIVRVCEHFVLFYPTYFSIATMNFGEFSTLSHYRQRREWFGVPRRRSHAA